MENKTVIIRAIKKNALGNISRIPSSVTSICASLSRGGYRTGLTQDEERDLERALQLELNTLSTRSPFWKEFAIKIPGNNDYILDLSTPMSFLEYKLALVSDTIANSSEEINVLAHDFYIVDAEESSEKELQRFKQHDAAILYYSKMSIKEMKDILKIYGYKSQGISDNLVQTTLRGLIDETPTKFNNIVNDPMYKDKVFIKDLELNGIIKKSGTRFYFGDESNVIGNSMEEVVSYLSDKTNNDIKIQLKKALQIELDKR